MQIYDTVRLMDNSVSFVERNPYGLVANMLDWDIVVSEFKLQLHFYVHIQTNTLVKRHELYYPHQLWVKWCHYNPSTKVALVLNNPQSLLCH